MAQNTAKPAPSANQNSLGTAFGVPHFWLIVCIGLAVFLVLIIIPGAKQRRRARMEKENAKAIADSEKHGHGGHAIPTHSSGKHAVAQHPGEEVIPPQHRVVKHDPDL